MEMPAFEVVSGLPRRGYSKVPNQERRGGIPAASQALWVSENGALLVWIIVSNHRLRGNSSAKRKLAAATPRRQLFQTKI